MINGKTVMMNVDFYDQCHYADVHNQGLYDEKRIDNLVRQCRDQDVDILFWRLTVGGTVAYPSKVETVFGGCFYKYSRALVAVLKKFDPLEIGSKYARKYGLKIYPWIDLYDKFFLSLESRLVKEHPEYQWKDRSGSFYLRGVPCYAYPEVRQWELNHIREVLGYDIDGLLLTMGSHCDQNCPYREKDMFGYNAPIVQEYQRRHGVDIRHFDDVVFEYDEKHFIQKIRYLGGDFDRTLWHRLKGEYFTLFLEEVRHEIKKGNKKVILAVNNLTEGPRPMARHYLDLEKWSRDDLLDGLILCEYWKEDGRFDAELVNKIKKRIGDKNLYIWQWVSPKSQGFETVSKCVRNAVDNEGKRNIDGLALHEAASFEF